MASMARVVIRNHPHYVTQRRQSLPTPKDRV
ncbi:MAG: hypothetical protein ACI8XX_002554 [Polaribacter sp.]|jgi:hypothetical protein